MGRPHVGVYHTVRCPGPATAAVVALLALVPLPVRSQEAPEPILEQLQSVFGQPGMRVGFLIQAVLDPGIDGQAANAQVAAARLRITGRLDRGFDYTLQTNFAATPSLLDARVGWSASPRFRIDAGRFKAPFSRELLTYAGSIDFVNRARAVSALSPGRQVGLQVGGSLGEHLAWSSGAFSGPTSQPAHEPLVGVARLEARGLAIAGGSLSAAGHVGLGRDGAVGGRALGSTFEGDGTVWGVDGRFEMDRLLLALEVLGADWNPVDDAEESAVGSYATVGWMLSPTRQLLARWDRFRAPRGLMDDQLVLGYNVWPTRASEIQVNWLIPVFGGTTPHTLLVNFQIGI